jgi:glycosyltransferase involved in cell wall biosynthesis
VAGRLAIFHPPGRLSLAHNPFGKDVANLQLFQALARHSGLEQLDVLSLRPTTDQQAAEDLLGAQGGTTRITASTILNQAAAQQAGALLRGQPYLDELAWLRRRTVGDRGFSLLGLVHTLAPPAIREYIAASSTAPVQPWDAIICTSPAVREAVSRMLGEWGEHLADRTGGRPPPQPHLPVVPLGVDAAGFAPEAAARARKRAELGLAAEDVLVLWVGRLSYFEKAFPQPMFSAVQRAATATATRPTFVMAGWFPGENDRGYFEAAARVHAPGVDVRFVDGNDRAGLSDLWAAADVFISLVDNIQETFGITPLEAMAAGLPVVASDWDGYRFTVRHGVEGFLIPTLMGPVGGGQGQRMITRHVMGIDTYQAFVGAVAQHTAVHIGRAGEAIAELIRSPDLRRRMGAAGRARVQQAFDWPVVARTYAELIAELGRVRAASPDPIARAVAHPLKGDPFRDFAHFASHALGLDTALAVPPGVTAQDVLDAAKVPLDVGFSAHRASPEACARALEMIAEGRAANVRDVLLAFPVDERRTVELGLAWMAKYGFVDWLT